jgi:serine/threonine-protein kinase
MRATKLLLHTTAALSEAHRLHLVHRDVKPANILVTMGDIAKLADFGLAKQIAKGAADQELGLCGTPQYMAPELFQGAHATPQSDVYALGVTYFSLVCGRLPFASESLIELIRLHTDARPPDLHEACPEAGPDMARIIDRCLSKVPAERYASAAELHADLQAAYLTLRPLEGLLQEALANEPAQITRQRPHRFSIHVALPGGRSQQVLVEDVSEVQAGTERQVRVFSVCGPADQQYYQRALELNASISYASLALQEVDGRACFVMLHAHPRATCDPEELRASVMSIARHADEVERALNV